MESTIYKKMPVKDVDVIYIDDSDVRRFIKPQGVKARSRRSSTRELTPIKSARTPQSKRSLRKKVSEKQAEEVVSDDDEVPLKIKKLSDILHDDDDSDESLSDDVSTQSERKIKELDSRTPSTSKSYIITRKGNIQKTPSALRSSLKKKILKEKLKENSGSDSFATDSEESDEKEDSDSDSSDVVPLNKLKSPKKNPTASTLKNRKEVDSIYEFECEKYFQQQGRRKILTSNFTLENLKTSKVMIQEQLSDLLKNAYPTYHERHTQTLQDQYRTLFKKWLFYMNEGFNVVTYGLGSKKKLLTEFHSTCLSSALVLVVNGFFPGLTINDVLLSLTKDILKIKKCPSQTQELLTIIQKTLNNKSAEPVYLIVHNIDGPVLRHDKYQVIFSELASLEKLHMICSIDHINSALLWDQAKINKFNFVWEDTTTFEPYVEETSFETSAMDKKSSAMALTSLKNVYKSLTVNSQAIFKILLNSQLTCYRKKYHGMQFSELYRLCRKDFVVSSDLAMRTQLTEFVDHELLKWKKDTDMLVIPLELEVLKEFKNFIDNEND